MKVHFFSQFTLGCAILFGGAQGGYAAQAEAQVEQPFVKGFYVKEVSTYESATSTTFGKVSAATLPPELKVLATEGDRHKVLIGEKEVWIPKHQVKSIVKLKIPPKCNKSYEAGTKPAGTADRAFGRDC